MKSLGQTGGNIGRFFYARNEIFDYINDREDTVFEQEPLRNLVKDGEMMVFKHDGIWRPMDTSREYPSSINSMNKRKPLG